MTGFIGLKLYEKGQHSHQSSVDTVIACHYINHIEGTVSVNLCMLALDMWKWC